MPKIKSDLTSKTFPGGEYRELEIPDETDSYEDSEYPNIDELNQKMISRGLPPLDQNELKRMYDSQRPQKYQTQSSYQQPQPQSQPQRASLQDTERAVKESRIAKITGKTRLTEAAKKRIAILCGTIRDTRETIIGETKFSFRTLKGKEIREAILLASQFDGTVESPFEVRKQILSRSIFEVDGIDLDLFLGDDSMESRYEFFDELDEPILVKLYNEYLILAKEASDKYAIKDEQDAKNVSEEIKK